MIHSFISKIVSIKSLLLILTFISINTNKGANNEELKIQTGKASFYAGKFHGRKTASGELFDKYDFTCAHKSLPFGTKLKITNPDNLKSVIVKVNDRGPFVKGRIVDLSLSAAQAIGIVQQGVGNVLIEKVDQEYSELGATDEMEEIFLNSNYTYIKKSNTELILKLKNIFEQPACDSTVLF